MPKPLDTTQPFTRAQALAAGLSAGQLRGPRYRRVLPGTYVEATVADSARLIAAAALLRFPVGAYASHTTAARLYRAPLPLLAGEHVSVAEPNDRRRIGGITCHKVLVPDLALVDGLRASAPRQLFVEMGRLIALPDLVALGDHLVRFGWITPADLVAHCRHVSCTGIDFARRASGYVRPGAESPMESKARLLLMLAGLPEPEVNPRAVDGRGARRRYDLLYRASRVIVEYDGRQHAEDTDQWQSDLVRRETLDEGGWRIIVLTYRDITQTPDATIARVWRALAERGEPGVTGHPRDEWRHHFPRQSAWLPSA